MRAHPSTRPAAGGRTLSRQPLFRTDPQKGHELLLPYAGRLVPAVVMTGVGGYYRSGFSAYDALCRTPDGRYFLVREVEQDRVPMYPGERPAFRLPRGHHWLRVKRVSLCAAMLHALGDCDDPLRQDLWDAMAAVSTRATAAAAALVPVTVRLRADQLAMLREVAVYDRRPGVEAAILHELESHIACSYEILGLDSEEQARARWHGQEASAR